MKYNPPAGSQDPDAKYVTGQPGKVRGSAVPAEAVEHPQREIVEVIKKAGLEPSGDDLGQLWKALEQLFSQKVTVATKENPGLVRIGDGLAITPEGLLSVLIASTSQAGLVKPRYGLKIGLDGSLDVDFAQMPREKIEELIKTIRVPIWLTKDLTVYVATTGSDTLDEKRGLSPDRPFATLQAATRFVADTYNVSAYRVTIQVAAGDYRSQNRSLVLPSYTASTGTIAIVGAGRDDVLLDNVVNRYSAHYIIRDVTIAGIVSETSYAHNLQLESGEVELFNVALNTSRFSGCTSFSHIYSNGGVCKIPATSESYPTGIHLYPQEAQPYLLRVDAGVINVSADISVETPCTVSDATVYAKSLGLFDMFASGLPNPGRAPRFTGTVSGKRYYIVTNGIIDVHGAGPEFIPGTIPGAQATGGQYI